MFAGTTQQQIVVNAVQKLQALRSALEDVADLQGWAAGVALADLEAVGFSPADAQSLLTAIADGAALQGFYLTGLPPGTYPQPASAYIYGASQRVVIGPQ